MLWAQRQRLQFIEHRLFWEGRVNRGDIANTFDVSIVQASKDLGAYRQAAPGNTLYDPQGKAYLPAPGFTPVLSQPAPEQFLAAQAAIGLNAEILSLPHRVIDPDTLRLLLQAQAAQSTVCITYQSLNKPHPQARLFCPHTFISDTRRWHLRGYCGQAKDFRDFLLARILRVEPDSSGAQLPGIDDDVFWHSKVRVALGPHPDLSAEQRAVIERDYAMTAGQVALVLRQACLPYFLRQMNLVEPAERPQEQPLIVLNRAQVDQWHQEVMPLPEKGQKP